MTELQKVEFDLLKVFIDICDRLNLHYFMVCGSALGAVKYQGFIPWDDDVDVALCRREYEIFITRAPDMLPENLFLQNYHSELNFPQFYSKLRNSQTTYIEESSKNLDINHGVYIDIFPLDGYPENSLTAARLEIKKKILSLKCGCLFEHDGASMKARILYKLERALGVHKRLQTNIAKLDKALSRWPAETARMWCNHGNWQGNREYASRAQYGAGRYATFEGIEVRIPERYDEYLTQKYGDWRLDLPDSEKAGHHYCTVCDLTRSYKVYTKGGSVT